MTRSDRLIGRAPHPAIVAVCPQCHQSLVGDATRLLACAEHGLFVLGSVARRPASLHLNAALQTALPRGPERIGLCPACRQPLREARVDLPQGDPIPLAGCASCGGIWMTRDDATRLREAVLARGVGSARAVGGYGGTAMRTGREGARVAEALFALLSDVGAYR